MSRSSILCRIGTKVITALLALLAASLSPAIAKDQHASRAPLGRIDAHYAISLGAFDLGVFKFEQRRQGKNYTLKSVVELSALLGAFEWRGVTQTSGSIAGGKPRPENYAFDFRSKGRGGLVRMAFDKGNVVGLSAIPSAPVGGAMVPLKDSHTKSVLDPLTAILTLSQAYGAKPCGHTLPIFDGKQRFNLTFKFRRYEALPNATRGGQRGVVCQIKYKPLGGYVANSDTRKYAAENNIEIAFRPVEGGAVMVPYRFSLPTVIGTARLDLRKLNVGPSGARVASARR